EGPPHAKGVVRPRVVIRARVVTRVVVRAPIVVRAPVVVRARGVVVVVVVVVRAGGVVIGTIETGVANPRVERSRRSEVADARRKPAATESAPDLSLSRRGGGEESRGENARSDPTEFSAFIDHCRPP